MDVGQDSLPPPQRDDWSVSSDGQYWARHHRIPRTAMFVPEPEEGVPVQMFEPMRVTDLNRVGPRPEHVRLRDDCMAG